MSCESECKVPNVPVFPLDVQQMLPIKEETPEEWRPGVDPVHIKEEEEGLWTSLEGENKDASDEWRPGVDPLLIKEEEELWSSLQGEQLSGRKEAGATRFALGASPLKSEDDEEKSPFSQLHQRQMKEEDFASCSSADRIKAATGGEDCGEAETSRNPNLKTSEDDSNSVETEVSDDDDEEDDDVNNPDYWLMHVTDSGAKAKGSDDDWKASRTPESGVNAGDASFSSSEGDKQFNSWTLPGRETREKPFVCGVCRQRFTRKTTLDIHARIHTGEKPFGCDFCGQRFTQKSTLITHMRIHTGQKPFECVVCGRGLSRRTHLNKHMRIHTGQKPFGCDVCGQRFICKKTLETHRRIHTGDEPFVCEVCGQTFTQQGSLITHRRIHTGQKPFHCDVCGQMFSRKTNLNTHMRIHTGEKPFGCDVCGQRFNQKPTLVAHKRTHTGEKPFLKVVPLNFLVLPLRCIKHE
uniref:C2H2-type domain-containing protein n=1 Tax=Kryptolebias marmoratus TaxID=37003 RepID=A0A3Q3AU52_KRYMA